jgi:hypothetical protein
MNSVVCIKKEVQMLRQILAPKPEDRIVVRMWLPPDDPRHDMTDAEIEKLNLGNRIVVKPLNEWASEKP